MRLTTEQENQYIKKYERLIWNLVWSLKRRTLAQQENVEDLFQEGAVVLLKHLRSCETMTEACSTIPIRDMINAMTLQLLSEQTLSYPKRTTYYRARGKQKYAHKAEFSVLDKDELFFDCSIQDAEDNMTIQNFYSMLDDREKKIFDVLSQGGKKQEAAEAIGLSNSTVSQTLKKMRKKYDHCVS